MRTDGAKLKTYGRGWAPGVARCRELLTRPAQWASISALTRLLANRCDSFLLTPSALPVLPVPLPLLLTVSILKRCPRSRFRAATALLVSVIPSPHPASPPPQINPAPAPPAHLRLLPPLSPSPLSTPQSSYRNRQITPPTVRPLHSHLHRRAHRPARAPPIFRRCLPSPLRANFAYGTSAWRTRAPTSSCSR